jgi:hypothetical protein
MGAPPLGSRLRFNEHFATDLHTLGRLAVPHKIVKGCPANPMRGAKLRNRERYLVFHGQPYTSVAAYCQQTEPLADPPARLGIVLQPCLTIESLKFSRLQ